MSKYEGGLILRNDRDEAAAVVRVTCLGTAIVHLASSVMSDAGNVNADVMLSAGEAREIAFALKAAADAAEGREPLKVTPIEREAS